MSTLTDEQIIKVAQETATAEAGRDGYILPIHFARAVIAADMAVRMTISDEVKLSYNWNDHLHDQNCQQYQHDYELFLCVEAYVLKHIAEIKAAKELSK